MRFPSAASWRPAFLYGAERNAELRERAGVRNPGQHVLSVAGGEGRNSVWLARRGLYVDAFDISEVGIAKARRLAAAQGVEVNFSIADCDGFARPEPAYDGVASIFVQFADSALRERLFGHIRRYLKPDGTLVLQGYTSRQLDYRTGVPPIESHLYTEALLGEAFADLDIVELCDYEANLAEGIGHNGHSVLIGLVARRPAAAP